MQTRERTAGKDSQVYENRVDIHKYLVHKASRLLQA